MEERKGKGEEESPRLSKTKVLESIKYKVLKLRRNTPQDSREPQLQQKPNETEIQLKGLRNLLIL